ncbi:MAG: D-alanyl-D-alanine carboxypeptidase/D-alanyl-D-alanine-endopeptidase [Vicinamibacterales bacterium]
MQNSRWGSRQLLAFCILNFAFCIGLAGCAARADIAASTRPSLAARIQAAMSGPGVTRATWGIAIHSLARDERTFEHNARALLVPASTAKVIALAAAAEAVGWDHVYETTVLATGPTIDGVVRGDLIIVGSGDPSLGSPGEPGFEAWIAAFRAAGIRKIDGRIIGDDNAFEDPRPGAMWAWDDLGYRTGALFGALNFAENVMRVTVSPGSAPALPTTLGVEPHAAARPLGNRTVTGPADSTPLLWPEQRPGEPFLTIAGSIPAGAPPAQLIISAGNPTQWFASVLRDRLQRDGIEVTGEAVDVDDVTPPADRSATTVIYTYRSKPLSYLALRLMKESVNLYGEAVFRLAAGASGERTNDDAIAATGRQVAAWGVPGDALQIVDGSGLSRRDAISADALIGVLEEMFDSSGMSPWMASLPIAGRDGTLENRFRGSAAEGTLLAKTGTMSNIRSLAGYARSADGEPFAFAIMVNNFEGNGAQATAAIDAIAVSIAEFSRRRD